MKTFRTREGAELLLCEGGPGCEDMLQADAVLVAGVIRLNDRGLAKVLAARVALRETEPW